MEEIEFLTNMATLSFAIVTFAALVVVLRQLVSSSLSAFQVLIIKLFAVAGFQSAIIALLPIILYFLGVPLSYVWRICCLLAAVCIALSGIWFFRTRRIVAPDRKQNLGTITPAVLMPFLCAALLLQAFGVIYEGEIGVFGAALLYQLIPIASGFFATIDDFLASDAA